MELKKLTETGFMVMDLPPLIDQFVKDVAKITINEKNIYEENKEQFTGVTSSFAYHFAKANLHGVMGLFHNYMLPFHEQFCNHKLIPTVLYGIRQYLNGSTLHMHKDEEDRRQISSIIPVDFDKDWSLEFHSHDGTVHQLTPQPGQIVFYESATCLHGRPTPFEGEYYRNFYVHYNLKYD